VGLVRAYLAESLLGAMRLRLQDPLLLAPFSSARTSRRPSTLTSLFLPPQLLAAGGASKGEGGESQRLCSQLSGWYAINHRFSACFSDTKCIATRFNSQLKDAFGTNTSKAELLGSVKIGILNNIVAGTASTTPLDAVLASTEDPLVSILIDRPALAYAFDVMTDEMPLGIFYEMFQLLGA